MLFGVSFDLPLPHVSLGPPSSAISDDRRPTTTTKNPDVPIFALVAPHCLELSLTTTTMKISPRTVLIALSFMATGVHADCTSSCEPNMGSCAQPLFNLLPPTEDPALAFEQLAYGKYCGVNNKCQPQEEGTPDDGDDGTCVIGQDVPCPGEPCDAMDAACFVHDACLDELVAADPPPEGEQVPIPTRCFCDVGLVAELAAVAGTGNSTGLCDSIFYQFDLGPVTDGQLSGTLIDLFQHEAVLFALPVCCVVQIEQCAQDAQVNDYVATYQAAALFCDEVLGQIQDDFGLDICENATDFLPDIITGPPIDLVTDPPTASPTNATINATTPDLFTGSPTTMPVNVTTMEPTAAPVAAPTGMPVLPTIAPTYSAAPSAMPVATSPPTGSPVEAPTDSLGEPSTSAGSNNRKLVTGVTAGLIGFLAAAVFTG